MVGAAGLEHTREERFLRKVDDLSAGHVGGTALCDSPSTDANLAAAFASLDLSGEPWPLQVHLVFPHRNVI